MKIESFFYNSDFSANTYLIISDDKVVIVDPGKDYPGIENYIKKNNLTPTGILLTHGHFDHIRGVKRLYDAFKIPTFIYYDEVKFLEDPKLNCSRLMDNPYSLENIEIKTVSDNEIIKDLIKEDIKVLYTPYHTSGSVCYYLKESKVIFTGDSLFRLSIGNTGFPTGDDSLIDSSLMTFKSLPDDVTIYPGHNAISNIGFEKKNNPFF